jgi:C4-type Zn-finger protein
MNSLIRSIKPKAIDREQSKFQSEHESCVLCGTKLEMKFEKISAAHNGPVMIRETAECTRCSVRARSKDHQLQ